MGKDSKIDWCDHTWNPWQGCHKVGPGCANCYMYREKTRYGQDPDVVIRSASKTFNAPFLWRHPALVFSCSWTDFFIEEADPWRNEAWDIIRQTPWLTYQILTKRPERILEHLPDDWGKGWNHVWLGISAESQPWLMERWLHLKQVPARLYWLSIEPMLKPMDIRSYIAPPRPLVSAGWPTISWVITGGESGPKDKIRLVDLDSFRSIRDQCLMFDIPYFHKQHGGHRKIDGVWGGRVLDGRTWDQLPISIRLL